jgi:serine/threonine protein kinase
MKRPAEGASPNIADVRAVFLRALDASPEDRGSVLEASCGADERLRGDVEELLDAHVHAEAFLSDLACRARTPMAALAPEPEQQGRRVGAYRLLRSLGRGGMGAVYLAERADERFERQVAIKLLPLGLDGASARERFMAERRTLAQLEHPGIARLLDAGITDDGTPYFIMEYVAGERITDHCDRAGLSIDDRLALFLQVCDAVDCAHRKHVVHRDLKPDNILVTSDGNAKLLDFGIAKVMEGGLAGSSTLTRCGGSPLTPAHASPEQVAGEVAGYTSDVYQLGVLLHQLLSGSGPYIFAGGTAAEMRRAVLEQPPTPPSDALRLQGVHAPRPDVPAHDGARPPADGLARLRSTTPAVLRNRLRGDLDCIVLKALRKESRHRYESVAALAEDVRRHLNGVQILAEREGRYVQLRRWVARRWPAAALSAAAMVLLLAGAFGFARAGRQSPTDMDGVAVRPGGAGVEGASTRSIVAYRFYEEALRTFYRGQVEAAHSLFAAATREDSTFALAWYFLGRSAPNGRDLHESVNRAYRLSEHSPDRERLFIHTQWAELMSDPSFRDVADSLATRYPDDPDGHYLLGIALVREGELLAALPHFERVLAMDSSNLRESDAYCRACDALERMVNVYVDADSLAAAERTARRWIRLQPGSALAWHELAWTLWRQERGAEALSARHESIMRRETSAQDQLYPAVVALRAGDYATTDRLLGEHIRNGAPDVRRTALWWQTISFRYQGRMRDALDAARRHRQLVDAEIENPHVWQSVALEAHVLFEMGRWPESAALIDSAAMIPFGGVSASRDAQHRVWVLTHATTVAMAAGDTLRVRVLADTMEALGRGSGFARDRRLHLYGRGMLLARQGDADGAEAAFRTLTEPSYFARANLEFARFLVDTGRPAQATAVLQVALRGPIAAGGFYVSRPKLHALLGRAWEEAGQPDSAAANYRRALAAWKHADPEFAVRTDAVRVRLAALTP